MEVQSIDVRHYRSIKHIDLAECGGFNVLIGQNNSGKSNILSAISTFFDAVRAGSFVGPAPGGESDFHCTDLSTPAEITVTFKMTSSERDSLVADVISDAPQMKNAVQSLSHSLFLRTTLTIVGVPQKFAYVSKLSLANAASRDNVETLVLSIPLSAGQEMFENLRASQAKQRELAYLKEGLQRANRMDPEEFKLRLQRGALRLYPSELLSQEFLRSFERMAQRSESTDAFLDTIQGMITSVDLDIQSLRQATLKHSVESFSGVEDGIPRYAERLLNRIGELKVLYLVERREPIGKDEAGRLLDLKMSRGGPEKLQAIQETVRDLLGVAIDAFQGKGGGTRRAELEAELDVDEFLVQLNGAGIREALRLVLDYEFERPSLLLVEEPEIHLHPALETSMMRYLRRISASCQVLITTHSTSFVDTGDVQNVYLVSKKESTEVQRISLEEAESILPRELGIRLSSLFMFDRLVFVEGPTDEDILREWATTLGLNLGRASVGFVRMGGARNFAYYANSNTLEFLRKRHVQFWFVIDRDERNDKDIVDLKRSLADRGNSCLSAA